MNNVFRKMAVLSGLFAASAFYAGTANAGCFSPDSLPKAPRMQQESWQGAGQVRLMQVDWQHSGDDIVGYWNVVFTSKGNSGIPDGTVIDRGLQQWHDDGTEFLNSSGQHPATQNYCLGTWVKTGDYTYKLNHFAYSYDTNQNIIGLVRIRETVKLSHDGVTMTGTSTLDIYDNVRNLLQTVRRRSWARASIRTRRRRKSDSAILASENEKPARAGFFRRLRCVR